MDEDLNFLKRFKCDTTFYNYIHQCKLHLSLKSNVPQVEQIHIETSVKYKDGVTYMNRYTLPILLDEFLEYTTEEQETIFKAVGFERQNFLLKLKKGTTTDIIFGFDGSKGKLYFDYLDEPIDPHIICYESTGIRKYYRFQKDSTTRLDVTDEKGQRIGIHIRINGENNIYWYSIGRDSSITIYYRSGSFLN